MATFKITVLSNPPAFVSILIVVKKIEIKIVSNIAISIFLFNIITTLYLIIVIYIIFYINEFYNVYIGILHLRIKNKPSL